MARTLKEIIAHADELAARAESAALIGDGHQKVIARLRKAVLARAEGEQAVADAVHDARVDGMAWSSIGLILGTTGQSARERYGALDR